MDNDPIVLYLIVRQSLNMSPGKVGVQIGNGIEHILMHYFRAQVLKVKFNDAKFPEDEADHIRITTDWLSHKSTKIALVADEKEWSKVKETFRDRIVVKNAGFNEVPPDSETLIVLWPQLKSKAQETILGKLQTFK